MDKWITSPQELEWFGESECRWRLDQYLHFQYAILLTLPGVWLPKHYLWQSSDSGPRAKLGVADEVWPVVIAKPGLNAPAGVPDIRVYWLKGTSLAWKTVLSWATGYETSQSFYFSRDNEIALGQCENEGRSTLEHIYCISPRRGKILLSNISVFYKLTQQHCFQYRD